MPAGGFWGGCAAAAIDWVRHVGFRHSSTHGRNTGRGLPLTDTSVLNRPFHIDWFAGPVLMDKLRSGRVGQTNGVFGGLRVGYDFDYYWGLEGRIAWTDADLKLYQAEEAYREPTQINYNFLDVTLVYYPWGDSKIRPYAVLGMGMADTDYRDEADIKHNHTFLTMPWGFGVKVCEWKHMNLRFEILDNLSFGSDGAASMNNFSFTAGMEFRYGGRRRLYWPWNSSYVGW